MYDITLIRTAHSGNGKCNSEELCKIIEEFKPELIFEELSLASYNECYGAQNRFTVETSAIKIYLQNHKIKHVPVVGSELTGDLDSKLKIMIRNTNYFELIDSVLSLEEKYGFQFLNSDYCDTLHEKITELEKLILKDNDDIVFSNICRIADDVVNVYEDEIIKNVYDYSIQNKYNKALMFIGVAHRKSIMQKIQQNQMVNKIKLNWTTYRTTDFIIKE